MEGEGGEVGCVRDGCSEDFSLVGVVASYWIGCLCLYNALHVVGVGVFVC